MAVDHVKSTAITNLDAVPRAVATAGEGAPNALKQMEGFAIAVGSGSADATYQLLRLPSACKLKTLHFESAAQTAGKFDIGAYYASDNSSPLSVNPPLAAGAINQAFFAAVIDCASAVARTDITNQAGNYTIDKRVLPLWKALGLTSDPKCNIDIVATVKTTALDASAAGLFGLSATYTT